MMRSYLWLVLGLAQCGPSTGREGYREARCYAAYVCGTGFKIVPTPFQTATVALWTASGIVLIRASLARVRSE